jgi:hypothetical protein
VARAEPEPEPASAEDIDCRGFPCDEHGVVNVVVENHRPEPESFRRRRDAGQRQHRRQEVGEVIRDGQRRAAKVFKLPGLVDPLGLRPCAIDARPEREA